MTSSIPICFYPTQKIMVDDDQAFTQSILLKMHGTNFITFDSPRKALTFLLHTHKQEIEKKDLVTINEFNEDSSTQKSFNINIKKLKDVLINSSNRDISVLLIDYHMPEMLGIDFLKEIRHLPIKKVLITGEKDYQIAIGAFNEGLVDAYIRKDDSEFPTKIETTVKELEWKYFADLSKIIHEIPSSDFRFLKSASFIKTFQDFMVEYSIIGFCMTDMLGSFLTKDTQGKFRYFLVRTKKQLQHLSLMGSEDGASQRTIDALNQGISIPYFYEKDAWLTPGKDWDKYLHTSKIFIGDDSMVWASLDKDETTP